MNDKWLDLYTDGRRLNKIIRFLETSLYKCEADDSDSIIRYANSIAYLTRNKVEMADKVLAVKYHIKKMEEKRGTTDPSLKYQITK